MSGLIVLFGVAAVCVGLFQLSVHKIDEGHVGVYYRGGALLKTITKPGYHLKVPMLDKHAQVQVTLQTDSVTDIPCGTSGGVMLQFARVEVVNRLKEDYVYETVRNFSINYDRLWIFDKIHHELNQFCSKNTLQEIYIDKFATVDDMLLAALQESAQQWCPGLEVIAVRITKPKLPHHIAANYEEIEGEKTKFKIAEQVQKTVEKHAETERKKATIEAERDKEVSEIRMQQQIMERESQKKMAAIEDAQHLAHSKAVADAKSYQLKQEATANALLLTPEYLQLALYQSVANNSKVVYVGGGGSGGGLAGMFTEFFHKQLNKPGA